MLDNGCRGNTFGPPYKKCLDASLLNSSTIDELGEGAWKDGGASSTGAERVG